MSNALTTNERLAYGKEAAWGVTPTGAGAGQFLRYNTINSRNTKQTVQSGEVVVNPEVSDFIQVKQRGGLSFGSEVSYANLDDLMASCFGAPWGGNILLVGASRQPITIERQFTDIGRYWTYKGGLVSALSLTIAIGKPMMATVTVDSMPLLESGASAFTGGGILTAPGNTIMDPITSLQLAQEGGAGTIAGVTEITLNFTREIIDMEQIGSVAPLDMQMGRLVANGTFSLYFADQTYITKALSHASSSLSVTIGGATNLKYNFFFGTMRMMLADVPNSGPQSTFVQQVQFSPYRNGASTTCRITRTP